MEPSLEAFRQATKVEVRRAEECVAWLHSVKVGEQHVLRVLRASIQFVHDFDRPRSEDRPVCKRACPFAREVETHLLAVDVLNGDRVTDECAGDQVHEASLANAWRSGNQELERLIGIGPQSLSLAQ